MNPARGRALQHSLSMCPHFIIVIHCQCTAGDDGTGPDMSAWIGLDFGWCMLVSAPALSSLFVPSWIMTAPGLFLNVARILVGPGALLGDRDTVPRFV